MEQELDLKKMTITDPFWAARQELVTKVVIPYQEQILNDAIPGIEKSHALANFRIAAGLEEGDFYGMVFQDSDVAKWLEGVAYSLAIHPDEALETRADEVISWIAKAQQEDGYLDTYFILKAPNDKFTDLMECHEMYCAGHMMEAAVAYYEATGKDTLLNVCQKLADCIDSHVGPEEGKIHGYPGHEEIELGLLRMYQANGNEKDLKLAKYFIDHRGCTPDFFHEEMDARGGKTFWGGDSHINSDYYQSFAPIREQQEARGHAVRCMYLFAGVSELARLTGDESLVKACDTMFENVTKKQMYLTGGIGQVAKWEGFSHDYDLPNDTAYAETCAAIGLVFFAHRMLKIRPDRKYGDIMERALYNGVLSGMQLDGKRFFYVNPLEVNPDLSGKMPGYEHVLPERPQWYACACCPPNVTRLVTSLGKYAWDEVMADGTDDAAAPGAFKTDVDTVFSHLYVGGSAEFTHGILHTETKYPYEGSVKYTFDDCDGTEWALSIRIPAFAADTSVTINGESVGPVNESMKNGYLTLSSVWNDGDTVELTFSLPVRVTYSNPRVRANANCVALERGPLVYAFEGVDNGAADGVLLQELRIPAVPDCKITIAADGPLTGMPLIDLTAERVYFDADSDDTGDCGNCGTAGEPLYSTKPPKKETCTARAIPYFAWGNRGLNQMRVFMPLA